MTIRPLRRLTRNIEAPLLFESFFVAAVASFLGIRWFLAATGYPRIGSSGIHVAHMLWGGLLLLAAVLLLVGFLDRSVGHVAAVIAGLGFGTFIDEIGKFVTSDNDYFFRPSIALIYGVFVVVFLVARVLVGRRRVTGDEALANALDLMAGAPARGLEPDDRARIRELLALADRRTRGRRSRPATSPRSQPSPTTTARVEIVSDRLAAAYARVMALSWADEALIVGVIAYAVLAVVGVVIVAMSPAQDGAADLSAATAAQVGSTIVGALLVGRGVLALRRLAPRGLPLVPARAARLDPRHPGVRVLQLPARRAPRAGGRPRRLRQPPVRHRPGAGGRAGVPDGPAGRGCERGVAGRTCAAAQRARPDRFGARIRPGSGRRRAPRGPRTSGPGASPLRG